MASTVLGDSRFTPVPSYAAGTSEVPLLGDTIGGVLDRIAAQQPGNQALVEVQTGRRWTYEELRGAVEDVACGLLAAGVGRGDRVGIWAPNCAEWMFVQYATAKIGAILVNINPAYRTHELEYVLKQAGISAAGRRAGVQDQRLRGDGRRGARRAAPSCARWCFLGTDEWDDAARRGPSAATVTRWRDAAGDADSRRPDQHPVHVRHDGVPQGRDADPPQHPQQRLLRRASCAATPRRTGSASRCRSTTASAW